MLGQVPALQCCSSNLLAALEGTPLLPSLESMLCSMNVTSGPATNSYVANTDQKIVTVDNSACYGQQDILYHVFSARLLLAAKSRWLELERGIMWTLHAFNI